MSSKASLALNALIYVEAAIALLFLVAVPLLIMATVGMDDRNGAAVFAATLFGYGVLLIGLIIALIWSVMRVKNRLLATAAGVAVLVFPFWQTAREGGYRLAEHFLG